ncbi:MAG: UDP-N-acetylmuramate dehydrogenase [Flavobacteriales bacterium]|nr:UDP-N-acetylmuramate dehydrogenase [Flavobacteriales bacterium]
MQFLPNADLTPYNSFGIAARAALLARFSTVEDLRVVLMAPELKGKDRLVLGGGSNILFRQDFEGVVLLNELPGIGLVREDDTRVWVKAGAGVLWHEFVLHCVAHGWGGIENMSLIPGKVGAGPMQNIGAYGVELKDVFHSLEAMRISDGEVMVFDHAACNFGYRESFFKREGRDRFIILSVTFLLNKAPHSLNTNYGSIKDELARIGISQPTIKDVSDAVIAIRSSKLPLPSQLGNAGSFFKNPVVPEAHAQRIKQEYPDAVTYPASTGEAKLSAGWLIEKAGWKGHRAGNCGVHDKQALVLVNYGGATGAEVYDTSERILRSVEQKFGVELEREVNLILSHPRRIFVI